MLVHNTVKKINFYSCRRAIWLIRSSIIFHKKLKFEYYNIV